MLGQVGCNLKSTIPTDMIFGFHGVLSEMGLNMPDPDYAKPVTDIFESATRVMIELHVPLEFLVHCT